MKTESRTKRGCIVREIAMRRGITLRQAAQEMGWSSSSLWSALRTRRPRAPTLDRLFHWVYRWQDRYGDRRRSLVTTVFDLVDS